MRPMVDLSRKTQNGDSRRIVNAKDVARAVEVLEGGGLVALPTETVYGLAADADNELAVRRVFAVKGRPATHPLIVHLADERQLSDWAREVPKAAKALAKAFWPGPLTLVLKRSPRARDVVTGGQDTVGVRVPAHPLAHALLDQLGRGVAAPSANRFGKVSPTNANHVRADLGKDVDFILDGGPCRVGVESTIIDVSGKRPALLRPGGVPVEAAERVLGLKLPLENPANVRAPGLLPVHYAPRAGLILAAEGEVAAKAEALLAQGQKVAVLAPAATPVPQGAVLVAAPADTEALARGLYGWLRDIDVQGFDMTVVQLPSREGLGLAVLDRLARASAAKGDRK